MDELQTCFERSVEGVCGRFLFLCSAGLDQGFGVLDVGIAKVGVPVLITNVCCDGELTVAEGFVDVGARNVEFMKNPSIGERFIAGPRRT